MKLSITAIFAFVGAITVAAEEFPANMPQCGRVCGKNMLEKASEFHCDSKDIGCMCKDKNFGYGIHDCSVQSCPTVEDANIVINWGNNLCSNAGSPANIPSATAVGFSGAAPSPVTTSEVVLTITSGSSTIVTTSVTTVLGPGGGSNASITPTAVTTSTWTSVFTSGSVTTTLTGETTVSGVSGVAGATSVTQTTVTSPIVTTETSGSSTFETTVGSTTIVASVTGDVLSSALSSTSSGQGAQMTAAPALGVLAAAGLAAALL
ncbi:uncharacterized protein THITE_2171499 [Thermothielavioides terrestris NRRL 8126]|uniref:CFEM domain-containing protein n=1 Tax=Thermothielavioides terrestris (strain ATCC 38088 / NRRL 8126) TaxID=578455 RepID=G2RGR5_THETT|nr:uncharacterized protein THITE_2171499 [Thermothielavioides terrestris NRRL 8126]AEO71097.1 hypothetical protein THITE_2171499 [Thermothielavioides terrestris NRRL 8126]